MSHAATLRLSFASAAEAARVAASLAPENEGYLAMRVEANEIVVEARAETPLGLLRTLDDAMVCAQAATRAGRVADQGE